MASSCNLQKLYSVKISLCRFEHYTFVTRRHPKRQKSSRSTHSTIDHAETPFYFHEQALLVYIFPIVRQAESYYISRQSSTIVRIQQFLSADLAITDFAILQSSRNMSIASLPKIPGTDSSRCILDAFRTAAALHISKTLDIPVETAFTGVDLGKAKNDFTVAIPRFRLKGKPSDHVAKVLKEVRFLVSRSQERGCSCSLQCRTSSNLTTLLNGFQQMAFSFTFTLARRHFLD